MRPPLTTYPVMMITIILTVFTLWMSAYKADAGPGSNWERRQLNQPSPKLLLMEKRGRVTIYDGLTEDDVDQAMDEQFERINSMMFVRVRSDDDHGLDDGCD